ncbi:hypothetical protein E3N88_44953 [Mikania micrantha]|uniref:Uncharacterized protein n=1 Tax=Mikania micrantha TaxID=192012 RepID=A0A5N6LB72_9ASTR|nr:hypothetical protein E3N88_44953 [Mikania micrantha]
MMISKLDILQCLFLFALVFTQIRADDADDGSAVGFDDSEAFQINLDKLTSKIQSLESLVHKKTEELSTKDEILAGKENAIAEKEKMIIEESEIMASLQNEVASLKAKGSLDANEQVQKTHTRSQELEEQVERLQLELEQKAHLREALEARSKELEKNILEMNPKLQNLQQTIEEQSTKLHKTERALKLVEEEVVKTKNEATQKVEELTEVHSAWLPSWLVAHMSSSQSYVEARWKEHGKPVFDTFKKKALEKKAQAERWAESHIDTVYTKWIPAAKKQLLIVIINIEPHVQLLTKKTKDIYARSKEAVSPHVIKIKEVVDPHLQIQGTVEESLKKPEIKRPLATKEIVLFIASVFLAVPIVILFRTLSAIFFGAAKKPTKTHNISHTRRKAKRAYSNK